MNELINKISRHATLQINSKIYNVYSKVLYVTASNQEHWYAKIKLSDNHVLVIAPFDNVMYFGSVVEPLKYSLPGPAEISYQRNIFNKVADDYQIVKEFIFGDYLTTEGEVLFSDYENGSSIISLGTVSRTGERADVVAQYISLSDVTVLSGNS